MTNTTSTTTISTQHTTVAVDDTDASSMHLTSTTAPGKIFSTRAELALHYKSAWHNYNLKRRQVGLSPLLEPEFEARLAAAQEAFWEATNSQDNHQNKKKNKHNNSNNIKKTGHLKKKNEAEFQGKHHKKMNYSQTVENGLATVSSQAPAYDRIKQQQQELEQELQSEQLQAEQLQSEQHPQGEEETKDEAQAEQPNAVSPLSPDNVTDLEVATQLVQQKRDEVLLEIDPCQSLFDSHVAETVQDNLNYMLKEFGFFVPDQEYLAGGARSSSSSNGKRKGRSAKNSHGDDTTTSESSVGLLIGYCHEKIQVGHVCLYCQRVFKSASACQDHMRKTQHCKLRYEAGIDLEEFAIFYDFTQADYEFTNNSHNSQKKKKEEDVVRSAYKNESDEENKEDDEWEDMSEDDGDDDMEEDEGDYEDDDDDDDNVYAGYQREVAAFGLDVTPLGELVFPDGRIIGHRAFRRYYNQRPKSQQQQQNHPQEEQRQAVRIAAGDRLYQGRIVNIQDSNAVTLSDTTTPSAVTATVGMFPNQPRWLRSPPGRQGQGLLVPAKTTATTTIGSTGSVVPSGAATTSTTVAASYTQWSIYRYRAAIRKQRQQDAQGQRLFLRTKCNMNRMDKKHNRLMNGVSVAHAKR